MIVYGISHCTYRSPYIAPGDLPPIKQQFHRFLLWQLIFHSYSESSTFGRPGVGRSTPMSMGNYRCLFWELIFGRPSVGRSTPHQMVISQIPAVTAHISFLLLELIFGRPCVGRSTPNVKWLLKIPTLRTHNLADHVLTDLHTPSNGNFTDSCSDCPYFILTLRMHIWQTRC